MKKLAKCAEGDMAARPKGQRGSWFAEYGGKSLPCVHRHWFKRHGYDDPGAKQNDSTWDPFIAAIASEKLVILTSDDIGKDGGFTRTGYIALWRVDNVRIEAGALRFQFTERLEEFS